MLMVNRKSSSAGVFYKRVVLSLSLICFIEETVSQFRGNGHIRFNRNPQSRPNFNDYNYEGNDWPPSNNPARNQNQPWWASENQENRPFQPTTSASNSPWWTDRPQHRPVRTTQRPVRTTRRPARPPTATPTRRPPAWGGSQNGGRPSSTTPARISEQKCKEYSRQVTVSVAALPLLPDADPIIIEKEKCDFKGLELIVGGTKTLPGEFPHMAAVGYRSNGKLDWDCGGSLISDFFVMTAAHCASTRKGEPYMVRLGEVNLKQDDDGAEPVNYRVAQITKHPEYKAPAHYNDIALMRLASQVKFNTFIRPACIYTRDTLSVNKALAAGWGKIDFAEDQSDTLLKVAINIIDSKTCNHLYRGVAQSDRLRQGIVPSMLCAGDLNGGKDTCQGDSGGPLQITGSENKCLFYIIGVTSFGKSCGGKNTAGVYTRVSHFVPWIENIVWPKK